MALAPLAAFDQEPGLELAITIAFAGQTLWIFLTSMWLTLADDVARLAFVRRSAFLLLVLAAGLVGIGLLIAPGATGQFFAWGLGPEPLAAFAGGVYVGAAIAYALALPRSARQVRGLVAGAVVLSVSIFVITLGHADQFDFGRLQAWAWVVLFAGFSLVTAWLLAFEREEGGARGARLPAWTRVVLLVVAVLGGPLAIALWMDPSLLADHSPFELPPLGGRFAGSWVALLAFVCGWGAIRDRVDEARVCAWVLIALPAGALVAALSSIDDPVGAASYLAILASLVLVGVVVLGAGTRTR
jgi:hypothetical protein